METKITHLLQDLGIETASAEQLEELAEECRKKAAMFEAGRAEAEQLGVALRRRALILRNPPG